MTTKDDFSAEEWELVSGLPGLVLAGAAWSDGKMVPAVREVVAGGEVLQKAALGAPEGSLVRELFSGAADSKETKAAMSGDDKPASPEAAVELLTAKVGEAFGSVRATLEETAKAVVERLGSGFWGSGSDKVSEGEKAFLARLATVLGDTPAT